MYLEFIKDPFRLNDFLCSETKNAKIEGYLFKISDKLITIKMPWYHYS